MAERSSSIRKRARAQLAKSKASCHICGKPIDYALPHMDPKAFVADHVIPLHKGGVDALSNIRAAHRLAPATRLREHAPMRPLCANADR